MRYMALIALAFVLGSTGCSMCCKKSKPNTDMIIVPPVQSPRRGG